MICPQCHAEYRPGYTSCADCHVPLVNQLGEPAAEELPEGEPGEERDLPQRTFPRTAFDGFLEELWSGEDLELHGKLRDALDQAGIPYYNRPAGDMPGVRRPSSIIIAERPQFGFTLAVPADDLKAATEILEKILDEEPEGIELPAPDEGDEVAQAAPESGDAKATVEVWSGADTTLCGFLEAALHENEITVRLEANAEGNAVHVQPRDEARAREIVREVVESSPPG